MKQSRLLPTLLTVAMVWVLFLPLSAHAAVMMERVSIGTLGQSDKASKDPVVSQDGRYVAFVSSASNLVAGDTNGCDDVFVRDTLSGTLQRVSVSETGAQGNGPSKSPSISSDGQVIAFESNATNLVTNDTNGYWDVFVRKLSGSTILVSRGTGITGPQGNSWSEKPDISFDGRYVAFTSLADNLTAGDATPFATDIYLRDLVTNATTLESVGGSGQGNTGSYDAALSSDGRYIAFQSGASNLVAGDTNGKLDIFVRDRVAKTTIRASVSHTGEQANGHSETPDISPDSTGRCVVFVSEATNLVPGDTNGRGDVFARDWPINQTTRVSVGPGYKQGNAGSGSPTISADRRYVAFESYSSDLVSDDTNAQSDIFVFDRSTVSITRVNVSSSGAQTTGDGSTDPSISANGQHVVFATGANNLVTGDTNGSSDDVFLRNLTMSPTPTTPTPPTAPTVNPPTNSTAAKPKVSLGTPVAPKTMKKSKSYTVYGSLKPRHTSGTKPVRIYKYKKVKVKGKWTYKSYGYTTAKAYNYKTYSRYKAKIKLTSKGTWRLKAYAPADSKHAATSSKYDYVKVK